MERKVALRREAAKMLTSHTHREKNGCATVNYVLASIFSVETFKVVICVCFDCNYAEIMQYPADVCMQESVCSAPPYYAHLLYIQVDLLCVHVFNFGQMKTSQMDCDLRVSIFVNVVSFKQLHHIELHIPCFFSVAQNKRKRSN